MRLKVIPGDFRVQEELTFRRVADGAYFVHVLRKRKLDTQQALAEVARLAGVARGDIAFAGLKDRQGQTEQWITIRGRRVDHRGADLQVVFQGRTDRPISSRMSRGNRFTIAVRDLTAPEADRLCAIATTVARDGLPNYFDDQRFGCLRHGQGFVMRAVLQGDFESALRALVAEPSPVAITGDVKLKRFLSRHWGDFATCAEVARGPLYGRLFQRLCQQPGDFRGALELVPLRTRLIHAFAYQSYLWNRALDRALDPVLAKEQRLRLPTRTGSLLAWRAPPPELLAQLEGWQTPLWAPGAAAGEPGFAAATAAILAAEDLPLPAAMPVVPGMALRAEQRDVVLRPRDLVAPYHEPDEVCRGKRVAWLGFALPRGSYATLVVKRCWAEATAGDRAAVRRGATRKPFRAKAGPAKRLGARRPRPR